MPVAAVASDVPIDLPEGAGKAMEVLLRWRRPQNPGRYELGLRLLEGSGINGTREVTIVSMLVDIPGHLNAVTDDGEADPTDASPLDASEREIDPHEAATGGTVRCTVDRSKSSSVAWFAGGYPFFKDVAFLKTNSTVPLAAARAPASDGGDPSDLLMHVVVHRGVLSGRGEQADRASLPEPDQHRSFAVCAICSRAGG